MKSKIKSLTPRSVWRTAQVTRNFLRYEPSWRFGAKGISSRRRLAGFCGSHSGQRCVIIGNGPSLRQTDLSKLRNEVTFGLNRIYLLFEELGFSTSYFVAVNSNVVEQFADDIAGLACPKFISWRAQQHFPLGSDVAFVRTDRSPGFYKDPTFGVWEGATVTYVAMQLAFYMGFEEVILIGVDHSFASEGSANRLVISEGDDPNHFDPRYFGKGVKWQLPDLETSEIAYHHAKRAFEDAGRRILDATIGGKLTVFPKVAYDEIFA